MSFTLLGILQSQAAGGAAGGYDLLETQILSSPTASITLSGLGSYSNYRHLQIRMTTKTVSGGYNATVRINSDSGANYAAHQLQGVSSNVTGSAQVSTSSPTFRTSEQYFVPSIIDILDFSNTSKNTTIREFTGAGALIGLRTILWNNTAAVTSISLTPTNNFATGCRVSIYGRA